MNRRTFDKLPKRLTVSFPLWLIYGTKGENSPYYDIDKAMRELYCFKRHTLGRALRSILGACKIRP